MVNKQLKPHKSTSFPSISVIIPTLNEEHFLPRLLTDLVKQKVKPGEVIIVDAHSTDTTKKVALSFQKMLPISFISVSKKNVSHQRNIGAEHAKGEYLFFCDADSGLRITFLRNIRESILQKKGLIFLPYLIPSEKTSDTLVYFRILNKFVEFSQHTKRPFSAGGNMIIERNFFNIIGGFQESLFVAEDHDIIQRAAQWGVRAKVSSSLKLIISLRRMKEEGKVKILYKAVVVSLHFLFKGPVKKQIIEYEMGGARYQKGKDLKKMDKPVFTSLFWKKNLREFQQAFKALVSTDE
ncbi:glycosyltransferase [Candidatus Roizmanbacteria bacterium]|nr:glycosyltransferase [Candidatus Roizmanbacteria bacterium]